MEVGEITVETLEAKIDALGTRLDKKIDALAEETKAGFAKAFEQTQGGFDAHRGFMELTVALHVGALRTDMNQRFDKVDARFDRLEAKFDHLATFIKGRPRRSRRRRRRRR
jgi:hypothetical protein